MTVGHINPGTAAQAIEQQQPHRTFPDGSQEKPEHPAALADHFIRPFIISTIVVLLNDEKTNCYFNL